MTGINQQTTQRTNRQQGPQRPSQQQTTVPGGPASPVAQLQAALAGVPVELAQALLSTATGGRGLSTVPELVKHAARNAAGAFLAVADVTPVAGLGLLVQSLCRYGAAGALEDLITLDNAVRHPAATVKLIQILQLTGVMDRKAHAVERRVAGRHLELAGQDPDLVAGTYTLIQEFGPSQYKEELIARDSTGAVEFEADGKTMKTREYTGTKAYRLAINDYNECVVTVVIKLKPLPGVSAQTLEKKKEEWLDGIQFKWNGKMCATNGKGKAYDLVFRPLFEDKAYSGPVHFTTEVGPNAVRSDETDWDVHDQGTTTAAHEFGHMLGNKDEYDLPVRDKKGKVTGKRDETDSVMSDYGAVSTRHVADILADFNTMMGNPNPAFKAEPKGASAKPQPTNKPAPKKQAPAKA
jgi:hypothetical protein